MKKAALVLVVMFLVLPAVALAATKKPEKTGRVFSLTLTGGGYALDNSRDAETAAVSGIKLSYDIQGKNGRDSIGIDAVYHRLSGADAEGHIVRLDAIYPIFQFKKFTPFLAVGGGYMSAEVGDESDGDAIVSYGGGLKYKLFYNLLLRADLRHTIWFQPGSPDNFEYTAGLTYLFGQQPEKKPEPLPDADRDGVPDRTDKCPDTPREFKVDKTGCPVNPPDTDKDGVPDYLDRCPDTPADVKVDKEGCTPDTDSDGVPDHLDECPGTAGLEVDERGCVRIEKKKKAIPPTGPPAPPAVPVEPVPAPPGEAQTLGESAVTVPPAPAPGAAAPVLPQAPGTDGRASVPGRIPGAAAPLPAPPAVPPVPAPAERPEIRVPPEVPETTPAPVPPAPADRDVPPRAQRGWSPGITIMFDFNLTVIRPDAAAALREIAESMKAQPSVSAIIEGHTDSVGSDQYNLKLSRKRAEAVKKHLMSLGIAGSRLRAEGWGESRPVADNSTQEGRKLNRRAVVISLTAE